MSRLHLALLVLLAVVAVLVSSRPTQDWLDDSIRGSALDMPDLWKLSTP